MASFEEIVREFAAQNGTKWNVERDAPVETSDAKGEASDESAPPADAPNAGPPERNSPWLRVETGAKVVGQGWKLHVTARTGEGETVLRRVLPVFARENTAFKLAANEDVLGALNAGLAGPGQIGKFVTVYPADDEAALRLAHALDEAMQGMSGPRVPTDRPLRPGSSVSYRYGGFDTRLLRTPMGEIVPAIRNPQGELEPDERQPGRVAPAWAQDPFIQTGEPVAERAPSTVIADRFVLTRPLHSSPRGAVFLALDLEGGQKCVVKQARRGASSGGEGGDALSRLYHEAAVLERLRDDERFPMPIAMLEENGDGFLAMTDVTGMPLENHLLRARAMGRTQSPERLISWGVELAELLAALHGRGLVYRDLKASNVLILEPKSEGTPAGNGSPAGPPSADGPLRLIDFETTWVMASGEAPRLRGTRGAMSPQQEDGEPPSPSDDIYALGSLLYFAATNANPIESPDTRHLTDRPLRLLNPHIGPELERVIASCLKIDPALRPPTAHAVAEQLVACRGEVAGPAPRSNLALRFSFKGPSPESGDGSSRPMRHQLEAGESPAEFDRRRALDLGQSLCRAAQRDKNGNAFWVSRQPVAHGTLSRDLSFGSSGPLLALAELCATDNPYGPPREAPAELSELRDTLRRGAQWFLDAPPLPFPLLPGLYIGDAGPGAALLRAGQVLNENLFVGAAADISRRLRGLSNGSPDIFNGQAGLLRFHLLVWDETHDSGHLSAAVQAGESLLQSAEPAPHDGLAWRFGEGFASMSRERLFGYAHGAAGIADALIDLYEATHDARYRDAAAATARWIAGAAVPSLEDGTGRVWPLREGLPPAPAFWCHGSTGIGYFFLRAAQHDLHPDALALARGAARTVAYGARIIGPNQCHGLAGSIEFLLDCAQHIGGPPYLEEAHLLAHLLDAFSVERDGQLLWVGDGPSLVSPDLMIGYAGVALAFLRLSDPMQRPHLLSRAAFRFGANLPVVRRTVP